jgi:hypothetical protein
MITSNPLSVSQYGYKVWYKNDIIFFGNKAKRLYEYVENLFEEEKKRKKDELKAEFNSKYILE